MYVILQGNVVHDESLTIKTYSSGTVMALFIFRCLKKEDSWSVNGLVFYTLFEGSVCCTVVAVCIIWLRYILDSGMGNGFSQFLCILLLFLIKFNLSVQNQKIIAVHTNVFRHENRQGLFSGLVGKARIEITKEQLSVTSFKI